MVSVFDPVQGEEASGLEKGLFGFVWLSRRLRSSSRQSARKGAFGQALRRLNQVKDSHGCLPASMVQNIHKLAANTALQATQQSAAALLQRPAMRA